jgi:hypothetical protein
MRTSNFSQILFEALQYSGNDRHNITDETFAQFRDFISARLREAWEQDEWLDICRLAQFTITTDANNVSSFTLPSDAGEVLGVYNLNPQVTTRARDVGYEIYNDGTTTKVILRSNFVTEGWFNYRKKCPILSGDLYNPSNVYLNGVQVYFDSGSATGTYTPVSGKPHYGNFYTCIAASTSAGQNPVSHPSLWQKVEIPYIFGNYLAWGAAANWLVSEGQLQEAAGLDSKANQMLSIEADKIARQQNQSQKIKFINPYS